MTRALSQLRFWIVLAFSTLPYSASTFTNPLLATGPDPWVTYQDGFYYFMSTTARNLTIRKTRDITDLAHAETQIVWTPPPTGPYSHQIWAPELHSFDGKWYIYFAADTGTNETHRLWVIENASPDPLSGTWILKGQLTDPTNRWAIDPTVFENRGRRFVLWSGWSGGKDGTQNIYIAQLANPWTIQGKRVMLSTPQFAWEEFGDLPRHHPKHVNVNEAPEILEHAGKIFLIYSASGCWTDHYALGMLTASATSDLLNPASWTKSPRPVFSALPRAHAYAPGHNAFFKSPDGAEDWIIYHANPEPHEGCSQYRSPRAQRFTWNPDGTPNFGTPVPLGTPIPKPSGEPLP